MKRIGLAAAALFLSVTVFSAECLAQKGKQAAQKHDIVQLSGIIKLARDKQDKISDISLTTKDGIVYKVTMNDATKLLEEQDGQTVDLSGYVQEMDGAKWFTISPEKKGQGKRNRKNK